MVTFESPSPGIPRRLYKYLPLRHAAALRESGELRIRFASDFGRSLSLSDAQRDPDELSRTVKIDRLLADPRSARQPNPPAALAKWGWTTPLSSVTYFRDCQLKVRAPDRYLYCVSAKLDAALAREFASDAVAVEIVDPEAFFCTLNVLARAVGYATGEGFWGPVVYGSRESALDDEPTAPAELLKPRSDQRFSEYRAVLVPASGAPRCANLKSEALRRCLGKLISFR